MPAPSDISQNKQGPSIGELLKWFRSVLGPEAHYYWLAVIYGIAISLLTLAVPISVQMLIDTVANTGLIQPVIVLSSLLLGLLLLSGLLVGFRSYVMELFGRRLYARLSAEISIRAVHAHAPYFQEGKRDSLFNRFFDIMSLQTNVPELLTGALPLFFQAVIGFIVVSAYHPYFLVFTLTLIALLCIIWVIWGPSAIRTAISESYAKYETAHGLEGLAENNDFYKSEPHIKQALTDANNKITSYIQANRKHFRRSFAQTISLLLLYALGSAGLLGIGGLLVIEGQLTLGQLVAAELIMSAILVGISQFGSYLDTFYEVCASVDKLSLFFQIPQEPRTGDAEPPSTPPRVEFDRVIVYRRDGQQINLDLDLAAGTNIIVNEAEIPAERAFLSLIQGYENPSSGWVRIGGMDVADIDGNKLRTKVVALDRPDIVECTIDSYLDLTGGGTHGNSRTKTELIQLCGLDETVSRLSQGVNTPIIPTGWPLSHSEVLRLKLAGTLLGEPKVVVLSRLYDLVERRYLEPVIDMMTANPDLTFIRFTDDMPDGRYTHRLTITAGDETFEPVVAGELKKVSGS